MAHRARAVRPRWDSPQEGKEEQHVMLKAREQVWQTPGIGTLQRNSQAVALQAKQELGAPRLAGSAQAVQRRRRYTVSLDSRG